MYSLFFNDDINIHQFRRTSVASLTIATNINNNKRSPKIYKKQSLKNVEEKALLITKRLDL